jgi:hypothetical protein
MIPHISLCHFSCLAYGGQNCYSITNVEKWERLKMMQNISLDLMLSYAELIPGGRPKAGFRISAGGSIRVAKNGGTQ